MRSFLGHGYGLRVRHYPELLSPAGGPGVSCVEAITENFLGRGGRPAAVLENVRREADIVLHGVSLSIGGTDPLRFDYLDALRELAERIEAKVVSDHLCFGTVGGSFGHDLWPMPLTEEALAHVVERVAAVQDRLGRRIALENPSSYFEWAANTIPEEEFLAEVVRRADALLLLDLNNVYVSSRNHAFDPSRYLAALPADRVAQFHLAGHSTREGYLFDDHGSEVSDPVWALYERAVERFGDVTCIVEWDSDVPELPRLVAETQRARDRAAQVLARTRRVA